jgi:hypothetical protein
LGRGCIIFGFLISVTTPEAFKTWGSVVVVAMEEAEVEAPEVAKEGEGTSWAVILMLGVVTAFIPTGFLNLRSSRRMLKAASSFQKQLLLLSQT